MPQTYICRVCWGLDIDLLFLSSFGRDQQTTKSTPALPREPLRHDPGMNPRFVQTCAAQFMAMLDHPVREIIIKHWIFLNQPGVNRLWLFLNWQCYCNGDVQ